MKMYYKSMINNLKLEAEKLERENKFLRKENEELANRLWDLERSGFSE